MATLRYSADNKEIGWYVEGELDSFRENGPCSIFDSGAIYFSQINSYYLNRKRGPAIILPDGEVQYTNEEGFLHRTNGPAIILPGIEKRYWVDDNEITPDEFFLRYGVL